ncbi:hypothetical protein AFL01nite_04910 [Aeromicrobium flavum]|uniref:Uncharacterized protein n=1 Tax=Aeromicrobium flavum TaxID=416568 RepID=A0A512HRT7_9ACTN|nr:hypothetical protein AFL01nite_04910 [Aeromicrobium flavum]
MDLKTDVVNADERVGLENEVGALSVIHVRIIGVPESRRNHGCVANRAPEQPDSDVIHAGLS